MSSTNEKIIKNLSQRGSADPALGGVSLVFSVHNESFIIEQTIRNYYAKLESRKQHFYISKLFMICFKQLVGLFILRRELKTKA